ncbi:MAG: MaoC family dehydratase N-terminal domain-containing protein [Chloroflexi bacterium]|nr:MaoC family dehydratase N-terminal domain-containing protein [Chloroflexota bacterium]
MSEALAGIEKLKSMVGVGWEPREYPIEREMVRRFIRAVGDTNPKWRDGMIAPPTFVLAIGFEQFVDDLLAMVSFKSVLMAGTELECYQSIKTGDVITAVFEVSGLREREGEMGRMAFLTFESTCKNQKHELVARCRQMVIGY